MSRTRKNYPASFKTKVVIAALRDDRPVSELASQFGVHSTVIGRWRREGRVMRNIKSATERGQMLSPALEEALDNTPCLYGSL